MKTQFEYKGYVGSAEVDIDGDVLVGSLLFIRDTIAYSAATPSGLEAAFREAVDDYLQTCAEEGDKPDQPLKGSFNVRVGPQRHRRVAIAARVADMGLNEFVCAALDDKVQSNESAIVGDVVYLSAGALPTRDAAVQYVQGGSTLGTVSIGSDPAFEWVKRGSTAH